MKIDMSPQGMRELSAYLGFPVSQHEHYEDTHVMMSVDDLEEFLTLVAATITLAEQAIDQAMDRLPTHPKGMPMDE